MGYRDDFYIEKNLIGYTGSITRNTASMYFYDPIHSAFGSIILKHGMTSDIGRSPVLQDRSYLIFNATARDPIEQSAIFLNTPEAFLPQSYVDSIKKECVEICNTYGDCMIQCFEFPFGSII
ncbi:MAG: hypothetical protein KAH18_12440 [Psychromonas sp.]|nr:hypothetical protein [Psychromonas sp.]